MMVKIPAKLEERLKKLFFLARERDQFVKEAVEKALDDVEEHGIQEHSVESIGGSLHLFCDGGSRGNPGDSAIGLLIKNPDSGEVLKEYCEEIGTATNNEAEYRALISGLEHAINFQPNHLTCYLDSELVVKQVTGEYKVKMPTLQPLEEEVLELAAQFNDIRFCHIPREKNKEADALGNQALDRNTY